MTCLNSLTIYVVISVRLVVFSHSSNVLQSAEYGMLRYGYYMSNVR